MNAADRLMALGQLPLLPTQDVIKARKEELDAIGKQIMRTYKRHASEVECMVAACTHDYDATHCKACGILSVRKRDIK